MYGITAVASASKSNVNRLETIQNSAIRLAIGARNTSPKIALQVEANLPPLTEYIQETCCRTYFRMSSQTHPILEDLMNDAKVVDKGWTVVFKQPFVKRCEDILGRWNIQMDSDVRQTPLPSLPPWVGSPLQLVCDLSDNIGKDLSIEQIRAIALNTISLRYPLHLKIYTDGSKYADSTTAAMWVPSLDLEDSWKLDWGKTRSIMGAEIFAINRALHWLLLNQPLIQGQDVVILSDSKSGIMALQNHHHRSYSFATNQILNLASILKDNEVNLAIQWIPSHVGLAGNEKADALAKAAHNLPRITEAPLDPMEMKTKLKAVCKERCQQRYDAAKQETHIGSIRDKFEPWPWTSSKSRRMETAMARLRIGHSRLKAHLFRFGLTTDPNCITCGVPENTKHILVECSRTRRERGALSLKLGRLGIQTPTTRVLLGGGDFDLSTQHEIRKALENFLSSSGTVDLI